MSKNNDLTKGNITKKIVMLSIPLLLTSFLEMAYSFIDMIWIAQIGSSAVSAIGTAGFFIWLGYTLTQFIVVGTQTRSAKKVGEKNYEQAIIYQKTGLQLSFLLGIVYCIVIFIFATNLINFFKISNDTVNEQAVAYLKISCTFIPFMFLNLTFTRIYNSKGISKIPFIFNLIGSITNIFLDPVFIFGMFGLKPMGIVGAGIATTIGNSISTICFIMYTALKYDFIKIKYLKSFNKKIAKEILNISFAPGLYSLFFCVISIFVARIVSSFGSEAIAVQKVGSQLESISWNTANSLSIAIAAFISQNFGANEFERIKKGYNATLLITSSIGIFATILFYVYPHIILKPFFEEKELIELGVGYFKILALSQIFQCVEIMTTGAFNGLGITKPASVVGILFNVLRVFMAMVFSAIFGLEGIWWAITISTLFKGSIIYIMYRNYEKRIVEQSI